MSRPRPAFVRLLGDLPFARRDGVEPPPRAPFEWHALPESQERPELDEEVHLPDDHEQPEALRLQLRFDPEPDGIYDVQWAAAAGARLGAGEPAVRGYRVSDGERFTQLAPFRLDVEQVAVARNQRVVRGDALMTVTVPAVALDPAPVRAVAAALQMELAQAVNAVFKGYMANEGQGGHIAKSVIPVQRRLAPERGYEHLVGEVVEALRECELRDGDVVAVSESVVAIAQGRLFPLELLYAHDPKTTDADGRRDMLPLVREHVPDVDERDLLCADAALELDPPAATAGVADPNGVAHDLAERVLRATGRRCDVVVSDTDTALEVREQLIGCVTVGATPLGATAGLIVYECMRVATAAEFCRGSSRGIPVVVCRPHERRARRDGIGEHRGYPGRLDVARERLIGYA